VKGFVFASLIALGATQAMAQRGESNEWSLNLLVTGSGRYDFDGGAAARNDGGFGIGASLSRNLSNYLAVGADLTLGESDYRARIAPGTGNAGAAFDTSGRMETAALRLHATWYLLSGRVTPFLTGGAGVIFLDADIKSDPPANACWFYPWYGEVCGAAAPSTTLARLNYGAGLGVRVDLPERRGFIRAMLGGEWIELSEARGSVGYVQLRADFGLRF